MSLKFVPPKEDVAFPRYASYGVGQLKTHTSLSGARNSLRNRTAPYSYSQNKAWKQGFILENVDGEWFVLYHVEEGMTEDQLPWMEKIWTHQQYRWTQTTEPNYQADQYKLSYRPTTMSKDQYAEWRLAVERERLGIS